MQGFDGKALPNYPIAGPDAIVRPYRQSVRPGHRPVEPEIVRIGNLAALRLVRLENAVGDAIALRIIDGFLPGGEE